jgi:hypothetical protein
MFRPIAAVAAALVAAALCASCDRQAVNSLPSPRTAAPASAVPAVARSPSLAPAAQSAPAAVPTSSPWPPVQMQDPDPRMRRFALEQWAREPTDSLDLVAAALVDPEESIRERAEQVFEEVLARRR